jgi:hypothetical protein
MPQSKLHNVMIDLETVGTKPYSAIISIGAVFFDPKTGETGDTFYDVISLSSCIQSGLVMDAGAVQWWIKQDKEAQKIFHDFKTTLPQSLTNFSAWLQKSGISEKTIKPWGNGSSFDITLLECAYQVCGIKPPWNYWNVRDVRTVVAMGEGYSDAAKTMPRDGTYHNALDDAVHQVKYVTEILSKCLK